MLQNAVVLAVLNCQFVSDRDACLIETAKQAIKSEVTGTRPPHESSHNPAQAVFVTIERDGKILGCRGDLTPRTGSLEQEVALAARDAAAHDPRYRPLTLKDLDRFLVTVTVVSSVEPISDVRGLPPSEGLVLDFGGRKGVVLPWEGKDPQVRLKWAYRKAGVPEGSGVRLYKIIASRCRG